MNSLADLVEQIEIDARERSRRLENSARLPNGFTARYYPLTRAETARGRRVRACWMLATDLDSLRALLAGERVPEHRLNQRYLRLHRERSR